MKQENRKLKNEQLQQIEAKYNELCEKNEKLKKELEKTQLDEIAAKFKQKKTSEKLKKCEDDIHQLKYKEKTDLQQAQKTITFYKITSLAGLIIFLTYYFNLPAKCMTLFNQA